MRRLALGSALLVLVAGCGAETGATTTTGPLATTTTMATTTSQPSTTSTTTTTSLPGEPIDFGPAAGDRLGVIGVAHDDLLNLRAAPGVDQEILAGIPPTYQNLVAAGETRELPDSFWILVDYQGTSGWVSLAFVAYLGATSDETAAIIDRLGGRPTAETMVALGSLVAGSMASDEPPSRLVMVSAPTVGDLGEVSFDVVGLGDDSVRGFRLHVFADPIDGGFSLRSVELTVLCGRGVTDDGLCV